MRVPPWLKLLWTVWVAVWIPVYWKHYGAQNFLYFCDLGNLFILAALWLESAFLFSWQAVGLLVFQTLYTIDLMVALATGTSPLGATSYMFDPHLALFVRLLSLFHVVTPPLLLWAVWRLGYDKRAWQYHVLMTWIVVPINYFWRPQFNVNWARGWSFSEQHAFTGPAYLATYLIVVPLVVYLPTHLLLRRWAERSGRVARNSEHFERGAPVVR